MQYIDEASHDRKKFRHCRDWRVEDAEIDVIVSANKDEEGAIGC